MDGRNDGLWTTGRQGRGGRQFGELTFSIYGDCGRPVACERLRRDLITCYMSGAIVVAIDEWGGEVRQFWDDDLWGGRQGQFRNL